MSQQNDKRVPRVAAAQRFFEDVGVTLALVEDRLQKLDDEDIIVTHINCKRPDAYRTDWLIVVKAETGQGRVVGFGGGSTLADALRGTLKRLYNRSMKWREDRPWTG